MWEITAFNVIKVGISVVWSKRFDGYVTAQVKVLGKTRTIYRHRYNFYAANGYLPNFVDHIDGVPGNDEPSNLRACDKSTNACNSKLSSRNISGCKGVSFQKNMNSWCVRVYKDGKRHFGGFFKEKNEAIAKANQMRLELHRDFSRG